jgi:hypothetical protein
VFQDKAALSADLVVAELELRHGNGLASEKNGDFTIKKWTFFVRSYSDYMCVIMCLSEQLKEKRNDG